MIESLWDELQSHRLTYLATPYTLHPHGREAAFIAASDLAGKLIKEGVYVFAPVSMSHPIAEYSGLDPVDEDLWMGVNEPFLERTDALIVGKLEGWQSSRGVANEIAFYTDLGKPIYFLDPDSMALSNGGE